MKSRICIRIKDALEILKDKDTPFYKELMEHENKEDWLIQGDELSKDGMPLMYIIENNKENNKIIAQHTVVNLGNL